MNSITIVTAFFNINRDEWKSFGRSEEKYYSYFEHWGLINNDLVAYVESEELKNRIEDFRKHLSCKTTVILINDIKNIDIVLYESIKNVTDDPFHKRFRTKPNNPEVWNSDYDYIMLMKEWCVANAVKNRYASGQVAWVDFGYLHGNFYLKEYLNDKFSWEYSFSDKINMFSLQPDDKKPIFDIVRNMDTYIMGTIIIAPDNMWEWFWNSVRDNMLCLNAVGLVDDDQTILLMCYRSDPNKFVLNSSDWDMPIFLYNDNVKTIPDRNDIKRSFIRKVGHWLKETKNNISYSCRVFHDLQKLERK